LVNENELLEIRKEINFYKDQIKNSAQKIFTALEDSESNFSIDSEMLEIYNALGKIGTISGNTRIASYSNSLVDLFSLVKQFSGTKIESKSFYHKFLSQLCSTPFEVKQKGNKFEITIPSITFDSIIKFVGLDNRK